MSRSPHWSLPLPIARAAILPIAMVAGWLAALPVMPAARAADPASVLEEPRVDVADLGVVGPDGAPRLLVVDPTEPTSTSIHLSVIERDGPWTTVGSRTVDLASSGVEPLGQPWLIGLGADRFALIVASGASERTVIVTLGVGNVEGRSVIGELGRRVFDAVIDDAGIADVAADGVPDLVIATSRTEASTCGGSSLWVLHDGDLRRSVAWQIAGVRLAAGVIGGFDVMAGDDLAAYAYPTCQEGPDVSAKLRLMTIRLVDGTTSTDRPAARRDSAPRRVAPPVRLDVDGDGRHELLALVPQGLAILDPSDAWSDIRIATSAAVPLVAAPVAGPNGSTQTRVAWMEPSVDGRGSIGTEFVDRTTSGTLDSGPATVMWDSDPPSDRWNLAVATSLAAASRQAPPVTWLGTLDDPACPDAFVPTAMLDCATGALVPGAAWVSTRPLLVLDDLGGRRLLVASGLGLGPDEGLPITPTPWTGAPAGSWRHGPSGAFVLGEVRLSDVGVRRFVERPAIDRTATVGPSVTIGARTGTRLVIGVEIIAADAVEPPSEPGFTSTLVDPARDGPRALARVGVPPGSPSGTERGSTLFPLPDTASPDGNVAGRWALTAVFLDDLGETGLPIGSSVRRDIEGPRLTVTVPLSGPVWPFATRIGGAVEPGSTVDVEGVGPATVNDEGAFAFDAALVPWPQTLRIVATDAVGNRTIREVSVVGGVDYRTFPWPAIVAAGLLAAVVVTSSLGSRRLRGPAVADRPRQAWDEGPGAELEDLPPGQGLGTGR